MAQKLKLPMLHGFLFDLEVSLATNTAEGNAENSYCLFPLEMQM